MTRSCALGTSLALMISAGSWSAARADWSKTDWNPIFAGVDHATGASQPGGDENHWEQVNAIRVDLTASGIGFYSTPHGGSSETVRRTVTQFVNDHDVQIAVNANFFQTSNSYYSPGEANLSGLAISEGNVVSPAGDGYLPALTVKNDGTVSIVSADVGFDATGVRTAVAGSVYVLQNGQITPFAPEYLTLAARTGYGMSQDAHFLYIVTIDGRRPNESEGGTFNDLGRWLQRFGAYTGINMDGGGSTQMARDDGNGGAELINIPSGDGTLPHPPGSERYDGNYLGIYASPLPEPTSALAIAAAALPIIVRRNRRRNST